MRSTTLDSGLTSLPIEYSGGENRQPEISLCLHASMILIGLKKKLLSLTPQTLKIKSFELTLASTLKLQFMKLTSPS